MRIIFLIPDIGISGGVRVVFEHANLLKEWGHQVIIVYPLIPLKSTAKWYGKNNAMNFLGRILGIFLNLKRGTSVKWFDLKVPLLRVPNFDERYIPDADIIVATWWETAYYVKKYGRRKGKKFYLIQHYEIWGGPKKEVERSYKLGLKNIVVSRWLKKVLRQLGAEVYAVVPNGINLKYFYPEPLPRDNKLRILMPYRKEKWKGTEDGIKVFEKIHRKYPNTKLVMFGPKKDKNVPSYAEFHENPTTEELRKLYSSCDIFLFPSHQEGFGLPPMEAMACKCAVVTTDVGAVRDFTIPGKTALVAKPKNLEELYDHIETLVRNEKLRKKIAVNGYKYIQKFGWEKSTKKLERIFEKSIKEQAKL